MCKHVAAALYGIGARLDEDPSLFFTLRGVCTEDLVAGAIQDKTAELLLKAGRKSARVIEDTDLASLFGLELDTPPSAFVREKIKPSTRKNSTEKAAAQKPRNTSTGALLNRNRTPLSPIDQVAALIVRSKAGVEANTLSEKTGLPKTKIYALVQRLKLQGKIKNKGHGVYVKDSG
jgi:predicted Rossmann fold nucleotide-binding protein DprA/Smf involved in DNA uptake